MPNAHIIPEPEISFSKIKALFTSALSTLTNDQLDTLSVDSYVSIRAPRERVSALVRA